MSRGERIGELDLRHMLGDDIFTFPVPEEWSGRFSQVGVLTFCMRPVVFSLPTLSTSGLEVNQSSSDVGVFSIGDSSSGERSNGVVSSTSSGHRAELRREYSEARRPLVIVGRLGCVVERGRYDGLLKLTRGAVEGIRVSDPAFAWLLGAFAGIGGGGGRVDDCGMIVSSSESSIY